ncbi:MAG: hypothetical protein EBR82_83215 [Caulobacteraceae bacterium]|nr:hypothetical protein [Caulobacteraceae bacterium]
MIEPAVGLGVKPKVDEWPPIKSYQQLMTERLEEPDVLIEGILHRGGKLLLGGGSKSYKSWSLIDLALSMYTGTDWWGQRCNKAKVRPRCYSLTLRFRSGASGTAWRMSSRPRG